MSFAIDLKEYGSDLKQAYESVVSSDPETTWAVFDYAASDNVLKPNASGPGDLEDFVEAFDDAKVQYGLVRVEFNSINKIVLVGWVGENVPGRQRLVFNAHMSAVAKQFPGHHVQITARSSDELTPSIILNRVSSAAGSKYAAATKPAPSTKPAYITAKDGADEDDWGDAQDVDERELSTGNGSGYKSSVRDELEQLRKGKKGTKDSAHVSEKHKSTPKAAIREEEREEEEREREEDAGNQGGISGLNSGTSYKPVGKIDLKAIREAGKNSKFADARVEKIEPSYKPVGKVDLKAIREQARKEKEMKSQKQSSSPASPAAARTAPTPKSSTKRDEPVESEESEPESDKGEVKKAVSETRSTANTKHSRATADEDDEPQLGSLSDRMKAFQTNLGAAKPKFDSSSRPGPPKTTTRSSTASNSAPSSSRKLPDKDEDKQNDDDDDDEEGPISVAAQLAKARLGRQEDKSPSLPQRVSPHDDKSTSKGTTSEEKSDNKTDVSTFASRFAAKSPSSGAESKTVPERTTPAKAPEPVSEDSETEDLEEEKEEEEEAPPAPKRSQANGDSATAVEPKRDEPKEKAEEHSAGNGLTGTVQFEHEKEDDDEISLRVGETITEIQEVDENWYLGRNSAGEVGLFPADFVEIKGAGSASNGAPKSEPSKESQPSASTGKVAIAQYDYEAGDEDELEFDENEKITEIEFPSEDWWSGKNSKGKIGLFPASYVTLQ